MKQLKQKTSILNSKRHFFNYLCKLFLKHIKYLHMYRFIVLIITISFLCISCKDNSLLSKMDQIKAVGDENPALAMKMLDSIYVDARNASEYTMMKYDLLKIRLEDKSYIPHTSNRVIENLVKYFEENGTVKDKQEAYYYAGSVYRDLDDTPRGIENLYKSIEAVSDKKECDSIILRNAYSNLYYLFVNVQDYNNALKMAQMEYSISKAINNTTINTMNQITNAYIDLDMNKEGLRYLNETFNLLKNKKYAKEDNFIFLVLYNYSHLKLKDKANECYNLIKKRKLKRMDAFVRNILGNYYMLIGQQDSAIACYESIINEKKNEYAMYDTSKKLFHIYSENGNKDKAIKYGAEFVRMSEKLDLAKNSELAATVNNKYKYHLDQSRMQKMESERTMYLRIAIIIGFSAVLLTLAFVIFYMRKKNITLRRQLALTDSLNSVKAQMSDIKKNTLLKEQQLASAQSEIAAKEQKMKEISEELQHNEQLLETTQKRLNDKMKQSEQLMQMLHKAELEDSASDVVEAVRKSAEGKKKLSATEWQQLYSAVNSLYPDFKDSLMSRDGNLSEQQMQMCYLMRIGLTGPQINNVVDISRTTVWRWTNANKWIYDI